MNFHTRYFLEITYILKIEYLGTYGQEVATV